MRMILFLLAVANVRWSAAALHRSDWLYAEADKAFAESEERLAHADRLMRRGALARVVPGPVARAVEPSSSR